MTNTQTALIVAALTLPRGAELDEVTRLAERVAEHLDLTEQRAARARWERGERTS